jgi:DNA-binding CsgD family transcriptional regulator
MSMASGVTSERGALLERERELAQLNALLSSAAGGSGGLVIVRGPAGIGKSALVAAARREARRRGIAVLHARGEEIEREFAFGVARQLLERPARARMAAGALSGAAELATVPLGLAPRPRPRPPEDGFAARHGLYWLAADLAADGPLLVAVDDAQWADTPSLEWLASLAGRLEDVAIALVIAVRDEGELEPALARLELEPLAERVVPAQLSKAAVERMAAATLGGEPGSELAAAIYQAAGGNPLWTRELLRALAVDEQAWRSLDSRRVAQTTPVSVTRAVLVRLGQLGAEPVALARAVAVLGSEVEVDNAAAVARFKPLAARRVAGVLERAGIFSPGADRLSFSHPIVREAVYADLGPEQRAATHAAAARALAARGAQAEQVASHLLHASPAGARAAVEQLRSAAREAVARGAPGAAVAYLRRAVAERPDQPNGELLHELGAAEARSFDPAALEHLCAAYEIDSRRRGAIAVDAAEVMLMSLRVDDAVAFLECALDDAHEGEREDTLRLNATLLTARYFAGRVGRLPAEIPAGNTAGERALLSAVVLARLVRAEPPGPVLELARAAWSDGRLLADEGPDSPYMIAAIMGPLGCDSFDEARVWLGEAIADAQARGSLTGFLTALMMRAYLGYRWGDLDGALVDARAVLEVGAVQRHLLTPGALAFLIEALIETGELEEAEEALRVRGWDGPLPGIYTFDVLRDRRGRLRLAQGRVNDSLTDLLEARDRFTWIENPAISANLDSHAALALAAAGRGDEARALVAAELERARRVGLPRQVAIALRAAALIDRPVNVDGLREAAALAARAGARLEQARALSDLGAALRRAGSPAAAREPLRRALDLATRAGATVLAGHSRQELLAAGGRPRRAMLSGRDALTPSEARIAELAAAGQANREIAQALFVTVRTVEMHLSAAYRKLNIHSRAQLAPALTASTAAAPEITSDSATKLYGRAT